LNSAIGLSSPHRENRLLDWMAFASAAVAGAFVTGFGFVLVGGLATPISASQRQLIGVALIACIAVVDQFWRGRSLLPQNMRQIPRDVMIGGRSGVAQFGFELGTGVRTFMPSLAPYMVAVVLVVAASPLAALLAAVGFGIGRSLLLLELILMPKVTKNLLEHQAELAVLKRVGSAVAAVASVIAILSWR
jgi:hypothetical protein